MLFAVTTVFILGYPNVSYQQEFDCTNGLVSIVKYNGKQYCVKPTSVDTLINRGWASQADNVDIIDNKQSSIDSVLFGGCGPWDGCDTNMLLITPKTITYFPSNELEPNFSINFEFSQTEFYEITRDLEPSHLLSLPEESGCMGCDDGGWTLLEFKFGNNTKTIQFDERSKLPILDELEDKLWTIFQETRIQYDISLGLINDEIIISVSKVTTSQQIQKLADSCNTELKERTSAMGYALKVKESGDFFDALYCLQNLDEVSSVYPYVN